MKSGISIILLGIMLLILSCVMSVNASNETVIPKTEIKINITDVEIGYLKLSTFLFNDNTNKIQSVEEVVDECGYTIHYGFTCYDSSRMLQSNAKRENITMGVMYIRDTINFCENTSLHVINYVYIDGELYGVEPQTDEIIKISSLKLRYNSDYITVIDFNDNFYPRTVRYNSNGKPYNFPLEVDFDLSGE